MTTNELNTRIEHFNKARDEGRITGAEWEELMTTLAKIAQGKPKGKGR
jgi:hypothetical protein